MADFSEVGVRSALADLFSGDAVVRLFHPLGNISGQAYYDTAYAPLFTAITDLERRDLIVVEGIDGNCGQWVGCMGHYMGCFVAPFMDIPPCLLYTSPSPRD